MHFTQHQAIAIKNSCLTTPDMIHDRYKYFPCIWLDGGNLFMSVILTIDCDEESLRLFFNKPLWHCSIAIIDGRYTKPLFLNGWTYEYMRTVDKQCMEELNGVGVMNQKHIERGISALHHRRPCTDEEIEVLKTINGGIK